MIIKMEHMRGCMMCRQGVKKFFEDHGIDWKDFLKNGVDEKVLLACKNALSDKVVEFARSLSNGRK